MATETDAYEPQEQQQQGHISLASKEPERHTLDFHHGWALLNGKRASGKRNKAEEENSGKKEKDPRNTGGTVIFPPV